MKKKESDSELLMELLDSLVNLDTYSAKEAIVSFENKVQDIIKRSGGHDRLSEWQLQDLMKKNHFRSAR